MDKTVYVVGGTNGVGKSAIREELLGSTIPYINADFISKELRANQASLMHAELARQYGSEQIKKYVTAGQSFGIENNLHEANTFRWLGEMQKKGYRIEIFYIGLENLQITTQRIQERVKRGEHYVPPNEVFARYENGMKLIRHYFSLPDKILFIDNTNERYTCLEVEKGKILWRLENFPEWINNFVTSLKNNPTVSIKSLDSIDEVRKTYQRQNDERAIEALKKLNLSKHPREEESQVQEKKQGRRPGL
jgi:predicted ABC-type ATPase